MQKISVKTVVVTPFSQNCRILLVPGQPGTASSRASAVVIDPGGEVNLICNALEALEVRCEEIWLTHSHIDHCGGVTELKRRTISSSQPLGAKLIAHPGESEFRGRAKEIARMYGFEEFEYENCPEPDIKVVGGEVYWFANEPFKILATPGHSPGHLCFYHQESQILFGGDAVFLGSIGRTDLPGGNSQQLIRSIKTEILSLPDQVQILPGHGSDTTVGQERSQNPFLN